MPEIRHAINFAEFRAALGAGRARDQSSRNLTRERPGGLDFPSQPARRSIVTVGPGRCSVLKEYPREEPRIAQGLDHRAALADNSGEVVLPCHAVAERRAQAITAKVFNF